MRTKLDEFKLSVAVTSYDVIILVETWLTPQINDAELGIPNYNIYRMDRDAESTEKNKGGGVMICIKRSIRSAVVASTGVNVEQTFVQLTVGNSSVILGAVYLPPNSSVEKFTEHCDAVENINNVYPNCPIYLFGDYNLPLATWSVSDSDEQLVQCPRGYPARDICDNFCSLGLKQLNSIPNNQHRFLDLIFGPDDFCFNVEPAVDSLFCDSFYHRSYCCTISTYEPKNLQFVEYYRDFRNADYTGLCNYLAPINWNGILNGNINNAVEQFYQILESAISLFVTLKRRYTSSYPIWFSGDLKQLIREKKAAHLKYKNNSTIDNYLYFSNLRSRCKEVSKACYNHYIASLENRMQNDSRHFWRFVNTTRSSNNIPDTMHLDNTSVSNGLDIVNLFATHFSGCYNRVNPELDLYNTCSGDGHQVDFGLLSVGVEEVFDGICSLPDKLSSGPDHVCPYFLKRCVFVLCKPLHLLFNKSLSEQRFPDLWLSSYVIPIFKSGARNNISNYRPISIQSSVPKLFEKILMPHLMWYCRGIFDDSQHGFVPQRSTVSNLLLYEQDILSSLGGNSQVDSIYTDYSKAFDKVSHPILLSKLESLGFPNHFLEWLSSYLSDRVQFVKVHEFLSEKILVTSGVPQGSHLGPLLFIIFLADLSKRFKYSKPLFFADDLKIYSAIRSIHDCYNLQRDLDILSAWSNSNGMTLNITKCHVITFCHGKTPVIFNYNIDGTNLERVDSIRDLGVIFDSKMSFIPHIDSLISKSRSRLGFIFRNTSAFSIDTLRVLYVSLVKPILNYASSLWSPFYRVHIDRIEAVQRRFLQYCGFKLGIPRDEWTYGDLMARLNIASLEVDRDISDLCILFKLISGEIFCPGLLQQLHFRIPNRNTRNHDLFLVPHHVSNYTFNSPLSRFSRLANRVDCDIAGVPFTKFKSQCRQLLR